MKKYNILVWLCIFCLLSSNLSAVAAEQSMAEKYVKPYKYGYTSEKSFTGEVPALNKRVTGYDWSLSQWSAIFNFKDGGKSTITNYDVFHVKKKPSDPDFSDEDGFGLIYKSKEAMTDLFSGVWKKHPNGISQKQMDYYREYFKGRGVDYSFDHPYAYELEYNYEFIRTFAVVSRLGGKFIKVQRSGGKSQNVFEISKWPTMKITLGNELSIKLNADGYVQRNLKVSAIPKGAFPDMSKLVSIKSITTNQENYSTTIKANSKNIAKVLGNDVDIVLEDGYGRTAIQTVKLPNEQPMDYLPTKLTLTEAGQLWVKFKYNGDDFIAKDYIYKRGMPMIANIKMRGATDAEFTLASMNEAILKAGTIKSGQEFSYMLGKVGVGDAPGKYKIIADVTINNPSHPDRAVEYPIKMYNNNTLHGEWTIERKGAETDLVAVSVKANPNAIQKGATSSITAQVKNVGKEDQANVLIHFYANDKKIYEVRKNMKANKTITVGPFNWKGTTVGNHSIRVHVDPTKEKPDSDRSNNVASTGCSVSTTSGGDARCENTKPTGNWTVTYPLITGYPTKTRTVTWTDSKGKSHSSTESYTDYSDPIWETRNVKYTEKLTMKAELNTKQGIPTDKKNPKESDRESRGSWSIIPWAKENGLDPNQVTKAGYGVEIKATTNYTTDWETKVPKGLEGTAKPIGGPAPKGPEEVRVYIYDTKGKYVKSIGLVKTSGNDKSATWKLPQERFKSKFMDFYERKFYTDVKAPDGEYKFVIVAQGAGKTNLSICETKPITIHGGMWDDQQIKLDTSAWSK